MIISNDLATASPACDAKPTVVTCINKFRCHGANHGIEEDPDGCISLVDDHDSNAGQAYFTGYCSLQCLLLDVWHELGNSGEKIGDQIRALKKAKEATEESTAAVTKMAEKIFDSVVGYGPGCSFVDLENRCGDEMKGDLWISAPGHPNLIIWTGVSQVFIDALFSAEMRKKIQMDPSISLIYMMDGKFLDLPEAKNGKKDYKKPHWLPVSFSVREEATPTDEERTAINDRLDGGAG